MTGTGKPHHTRPMDRTKWLGYLSQDTNELMLIKFIDSLNSWNSELMAKITPRTHTC